MLKTLEYGKGKSKVKAFKLITWWPILKNAPIGSLPFYERAFVTYYVINLEQFYWAQREMLTNRSSMGGNSEEWKDVKLRVQHKMPKTRSEDWNGQLKEQRGKRHKNLKREAWKYLDFIFLRI